MALEAAKQLGSVAVYSKKDKLWACGENDLAALNDQFNSIDQMARTVHLGNLEELVVFGEKECEIATAQTGYVVCSAADKLDKAYVCQEMFAAGMNGSS